jgi:CheY-like chemotaxis protein
LSVVVQTVLIIDDNEDEVLLAKKALAKTGLKIRTEVASSGKAGIAFLEGEGVPPALIMIDLKMPGMSGVETLRRIRADGRFTDIPVIVATNSSLASDRQDAIDAGADVFFQKSFDIEEYGKEITRLLERWLKK